MPERGAIIAAIAAAVLTASLSGAQAFDETKYPDWSGQWSRVPDGGNPRYDPSKPLRGQQAPLRPEYKTMHEASMAAQKRGGHGLDLAYSCLPHGMPRMMAGVSSFEFLLSPSVTHIVFEWNVLSPRRIFTDGRGWPKVEDQAEDLTYVGYSLGKWVDTDGDGRFDELQIETRHVRNPRTFDQTGMPMANDDEGVITERIFLDKDKPDVLHDEMTTVDNSLTRPWTAMKNYRRAKKVAWKENNCIEGNAWVTIGKEVYYRSADGTIMPLRDDQPPPDLKYFNRTKR